MMNFCLVPYIYTLEITSECNVNCVGCGNVFAHGDLYMEPEQLRIALDRISPYAEMLRVTGGEPTLSPAFGEIVQLVASPLSCSRMVFGEILLPSSMSCGAAGIWTASWCLSTDILSLHLGLSRVGIISGLWLPISSEQATRVLPSIRIRFLRIRTSTIWRR